MTTYAWTEHHMVVAPTLISSACSSGDHLTLVNFGSLLFGVCIFTDLLAILSTPF